MQVFDHLPTAAHDKVKSLLTLYPINLKVVKKRKTKHGDFRKSSSGQSQITINENDNPYRFLITLLHELAHHVAYLDYGFNIRPHGKEWKRSFLQLSAPFLVNEVFPQPLLTVFAQHLKNPKASSDTDQILGLALKPYDPPTDKKAIFEISRGSLFQLDDNRVFRKGEKRRKRFICREIETNRDYLFQPNAQVKLIEE